MFENQQIAFIGAGIMAEAMISGLVGPTGVVPGLIIAGDPRPERGLQLSRRFGIQYEADNVKAIHGASLVVLAIKPQAMRSVLTQLSGRIPTGALLVSIAAGTYLEHIKQALKHSQVVRAMPNTPARIGMGITVWVASRETGQEHRNMASKLFQTFGEEVEVNGEEDLDRATALSGTGPAYIFLFLEAMIEAGVHMGFDRHLAERLVYQTVRGSVEYAGKSGEHLAVLRNHVTSPGGTTAEAIYCMERGGMRTVLADAIWAAYNRAVELGKAVPAPERNPDSVVKWRSERPKIGANPLT